MQESCFKEEARVMHSKERNSIKSIKVITVVVIVAN